MRAPKITLKRAKEKAEKKSDFRASDFLTAEQMDEIHENNLKGKKEVGYNEVDSYIAEIIARFGYDTYVAWKFGEISEENMVKYLAAEKAREADNRLKTECIIVASVAGANHGSKKGNIPKSLRAAIKMLKSEEKLSKGGKK